MKSLKNNIPTILLILFELAVGILLLINPEGFTSAVITCFGVVLIVVGIVYLINFVRFRKNTGGTDYFAAVLAVISLVIGCVCAFLTSWVMGLFAVVAVIYGVILVISGIYKIKAYFDARKLFGHAPILALISAVLSAVLGVIIIVNPFDTVNLLWVFVGISLIVEAAIDLAALLFAGRSGKA